MATVERINEQISNIVEWNNNLKKCRNDINNMIKMEQSMSKQREVKIKEITRKTYKNSSYCDVLDNVEVLQKYFDDETKLLGIDFGEQINLKNTESFGSMNEDGVNDKFVLPSVILTNVDAFEEDVDGYKVEISWKVESNQVNEVNEFMERGTVFVIEYIEDNDDDEQKGNSMIWTEMGSLSMSSSSPHNFCGKSNLNKFSYNKLYKFKINYILCLPPNFKISSNIFSFFKQIKEHQISINVTKSTSSPSDKWKAENVLKSDGSYYAVYKSSDILIIFGDNFDDKYYIPTKCSIKGTELISCPKEFDVFIGNIFNDSWIKLNKFKMKMKWNNKEQIFSFDIDNDLLIKKIKKNKYKHYKLQIKSNYGGYYTKLYEFKLFGIEY